jgi:hypothetical protein
MHAAGVKLWIVPDLDLDHHSEDDEGKPKVYKGNYHRWLLKQPGGSEWSANVGGKPGALVA